MKDNSVSKNYFFTSIIFNLILLLILSFVVLDINFFDYKSAIGPGQKLPPDLAKSAIQRAKIDGILPRDVKTRSVFFPIDSLYKITDTSNYTRDPNYRRLNSATKTIGVNFYFGQYSRNIIKDINYYLKSRRINDTLEYSASGYETLFAVPAFIDDTNGSIFNLNVQNIFPRNLGSLCPNNCPKDDYFYSN